MDVMPSTRAQVLIVCTANQCRSPMAEVLLRRALEVRGVAADVASAGSLPGGVPASTGSVEAMARRRLDLSGHRSRPLTTDEAGRADLVICMARSHCREVMVLHPPAWPRTFTLRELVRRGETIGARRAGQTLDEWLAALGQGRVRAALLSDDPDDDVADPIGGPSSAYEAIAVILEDSIDQAVELAFPEERTG